MKKIICMIISMLIILNTVVTSYALETVEKEQNSNENVSNELEDKKEQNITSDSNVDKKIDNTGDESQNQCEDLYSDNNSTDQNNEFNKSIDENITSVISNSEEQAAETSILYQTHVQDYGWQGWKSDGQMSGTSGEGKRLEGIKIKLENNVSYEGDIQYQTHVQDYGWQGWKSNGQMSGTSGEGKRLEAIKIRLSGNISETYDIYYRVHIQDRGWLGWASNGASAGSETYGKRLEGIEIKLIRKGNLVPDDTKNPYLYPGHVYYSTQVQDYGWLSNVGDGKTSGIVGKSKRLEALKVSLCDLPYNGNIEYSTHIQDYGWQSYKKNGNISGTVGESKRLEALKIRLTGDINNYYDVYYRVHVQNIGWLSWTSNDSKAGTEGFALRIEAIEICLVEKGKNAPGDTSRPFVEQGNVEYSSYVQNIGWQNYVSNGLNSGTVGQCLRLEAIKIKLGNNSYEGNIEYSTHVQDYGWMNYVSNDSVSGTTNQAKRIEAIKIRLTGEISNYYDVFYRVQCQDIGWLGWTANDRVAGTMGGSYRVEAFEIKLYPKFITNPGISNRASISFENNNGFMICKDANGTLYEDAQEFLGARSSYALRVNKSTNVVTVLIANGAGDYNIAYKRFICSTGNDTPYGTYYTPVKYRWRYLVGPSYGQYCTRIVGGILFHSLPYDKQDPFTLQTQEYNKLGTTCSHGCVRLRCIDAKWIYDNCALGTRVDFVDGSDPLSKPVIPKIFANQRWDPTDPNI